MHVEPNVVVTHRASEVGEATGQNIGQDQLVVARVQLLSVVAEPAAQRLGGRQAVPFERGQSGTCALQRDLVVPRESHERVTPVEEDGCQHEAG
jgi:hypothetical protein